MPKSWFHYIGRRIAEIDKDNEKDWDELKTDLIGQTLDRPDTSKAKADQLKQAIDELGLHAEEIKGGVLPMLWPASFAAGAEFDGARVILDWGNLAGTHLVADRLPMIMTLRTESGLFISSPIRDRLGTFWKEPSPIGEVLIGDLAFDNVISSHGNDTLCRALLNAGLREAATLVIGSGTESWCSAGSP